LYFRPPNKAIILSEALRGSVANRELYGAESKDPGDAHYPCRSELFTTEAASGGPATVFLFSRGQETQILYSGIMVEKLRTSSGG
jgi:hypothetical protein